MADIAQGIVSFFSPNSLIYIVLYFLLTLGFTYFYTAFTFKPDETAEQLRKNGGFIPGIRPGPADAGLPCPGRQPDHLRRRALPGHRRGLAVGRSPWRSRTLGALGLGGTSLLIVVSRRGRDDEADRGAADDAQLRRLHPMTVRPARRRTGGHPRVGRAPHDARPAAPVIVLVLPRRPGRREGTQAPRPARAPRRAASSPPATCSARPSRDGRALGREADRYMSRGQLVPTRSIVACFLERLGRRRRRPRRDPRRLPADPRARPRRSTRPSPSAGSRVDARCYIDVPTDELVDAPGRPLDLRGQRPRLQHRLEPAARRRRLRPRRLAAGPARRRPAGDGPGPDGAAAPAARSRSSTTTGRPGVLRDGRRAAADRRR